MRTYRALVTGIVTVLALLLPLNVATAAGNPDAAAKAGAWVVTQIKSDATGEVGATIDSVLALAAAGSGDKVSGLVSTVKSGASKYAATGPDAAAKLALLASVTGEDATSFGGVDTIAELKKGIKADGSFGAYPGPFASGMAVVALTRNGQEVPATMIQWLLKQGNTDGGFGYAAGQPSDADNTGMALLALTAAKDAPGAADAAKKAIDWAAKNQGADGSWTGFNPVNSTAVMGMALDAAGEDTAKAVAYVVSQQMADGALPNAGKADLLATNQALLLLGDVSYLDVTLKAAEPSAAPSEAASVPATTAPTSDPAVTGGPDPMVWWGVGAAVVVLIVIVAAFGRKKAA